MNSAEAFGKVDGHTVEIVTIENGNGTRAAIATYGARLVRLLTPDRTGRLDDIVLGFDTLDGYLDIDPYFGATCGRYANRIAGATVRIDGRNYPLDPNEGRNHLHGGSAGFHRKIWTIDELTDRRVSLTSVTEDGEMGYPGRCALRCDYALSDDDCLTITMAADTTRPTIMNMAHHSYFSLTGQGSGNVLAQELRLAGAFYIPVGHDLLPTGEVLGVTGTPFDFTSFKPIGRDIAATEEFDGYDHCFCLAESGPLHACAEIRDPASGRRMTLLTSEPGVQVYTGGHLRDTMPGKNGARLCRFAGLALETQKYPGTPGFAHFPSARLDPGETYRHEMAFRFETDAA